MSREELFKDIFEREIKGGCFDVKLDNLSLYHFIKRGTRTWVAHCHGYELGYTLPPSSVWECKKNILLSLIQIVCILVRGKKYDNFIYSFSRLERVKGKYVEKFTDPLIDFSDIDKSYIIFEPDFCGTHKHPRLHSRKTIFADGIPWLAKILATHELRKSNSLFHQKWEELKSKIEDAFPETNLSKTNYKRYVVEGYYTVKIYQFIFRRLHIKNFIAPSRPSHLSLIPAAKKEGVKAYELQHGVLYELTHRTYGGFMDPLFTPDKFLSFGIIKNASYYGINDKDVINIGWAFKCYLDQITDNHLIKDNSVLVISEGVVKVVQKNVIKAVFFLADLNRDIHFYYRPHPEEVLSDEQLEEIRCHRNISIDEKSENLLVVLNSFSHVIGCNSSGMYDALDMKKRVGKLSLCGLVPRYAQQEDRNYFYEISDNESFVQFMNNTIAEKPYRKHYSAYNKELLNKLIKSDSNV